jgi:hypothetical protein
MSCTPASTRPAAGTESPPALAITVLFTDVPHTLAALRHAGELGTSLNASLRILVPVVVPYPLELSPTATGGVATSRSLKTLASDVGIPTLIYMIYCRDREDALERNLAPHSIVVLCWRRRWPFDTTRRLARRLTRRGHQVVVVEPE